MKNEKYSDMAAILPHGSPMVLIDRVLEYDVENLSISAEFDVREGAMFYDVGLEGVPPWVGLEYMAQATAALSGIRGIESRGQKPKLGFILGARKFLNNVSCYMAGQTYRVDAAELFNDGSLGSFECTISDSGGGLCAASEINVFSPEDPGALLS